MIQKKILVVDDSSTVRQQISMVLERGGGYKIIMAEDGFDALEKLRTNPDVSLVITDMKMPRLNGIEFLECMKRESEYKNIPVIVVTTETEVGLIEQAKQLGAKGWLVKPFQPEMLKKAVESCLGQVGAHQPPARTIA